MSRESFEAGYLDKLAELGGGMRRSITKAAAGRLPDYDKLSDDAVLKGWAKGTEAQRSDALRIAGIDAGMFANTTDNAARAGLIRQAMKARAQANGLSVAARNAAVAAARSDGPRLGGAKRLYRPAAGSAASQGLTEEEKRDWGINALPAGMTVEQARAIHNKNVQKMRDEIVDVRDSNGNVVMGPDGRPVQRTRYADQLARAAAYDAAAAKGWDDIRRISAELARGALPGQNGKGLSYGQQMTYFANRDGYRKSPEVSYIAATGSPLTPNAIAVARRAAASRRAAAARRAEAVRRAGAAIVGKGTPVRIPAEFGNNTGKAGGWNAG